MNRSRRLRVLLAAVLTGAESCARLAAAQTAAPPAQAEAARLEFRAPSGCSSAEEFAAQVRRRSARLVLVSAGAAARSLRVEIQQAGTSWRGSIRVVEPDGTSRARQLKARSCAEAIDALSLIAAVTLDPDALAEPPEAHPEGKTPPDAPRPDDRAPSTTKPAPRASQALPVQPAPYARAERSHYRVGVGASAIMVQGVAPALLPGGAISVALELASSRTIAWYARLSLGHAERRGLQEPGGNASFALTQPLLDLCPLRLGPRVLGVRPCAFGGFSWMKAWGEAVAESQPHERLRGVVGVGLSAQLRLSEAIEIIVDGRAGVPLVRDAYALDDVVFYRTARLGFSGGAGLVAGFP